MAASKKLDKKVAEKKLDQDADVIAKQERGRGDGPVDEPKEAPPAEGWGIYDREARDIGYFYLESDVDDAESKARMHFARLHRHSGAVLPDLRLVKFSEVAKSDDVRDNPDDWAYPEDVPAVDRWVSDLGPSKDDD